MNATQEKDLRWGVVWEEAWNKSRICWETHNYIVLEKNSTIGQLIV